MISHIIFEPITYDLQGHGDNAYQKRKAELHAYFEEYGGTRLVGELIYSVFNFYTSDFDVAVGLEEDDSEEWGESDFFTWYIMNKDSIETSGAFMGKTAFLHELTLSPRFIDKEFIQSIITAMNSELGINDFFTDPMVLHPSPKLDIKSIIAGSLWRPMSKKYFLRSI